MRSPLRNVSRGIALIEVLVLAMLALTIAGLVIYSLTGNIDEPVDKPKRSVDVEPVVTPIAPSDNEIGSTTPTVKAEASTSPSLMCGPMPAWAKNKGTGAFTYSQTNGTSSETGWRVKN